MTKCAFCRKQADARVDIGGALVPVCAKHFGSKPIVAIPIINDTQVMVESMINMQDKLEAKDNG